MLKKLFLFLGLGSVFANVQATDLYEAYLKALSFNAEYLRAIANNEVGAEYPNIAKAKLFPQISVSGGLSENYFSQSGSEAYYHQSTYGAQFSQVIFDFSKFSDYVRSKFAHQLADLQLINARQQLMVNVAKAYFDVLYAKDILLATQLTKQALEKQTVQAQAAFRVGGVTIADVNDAKAGYDAASANEIRDTNNLINKKNIFQNITGIDPEQVQPIIESINLVLPEPESDALWSDTAKRNNLNVLVSAKQLDMAKEDINVIRAGHYPTLALNIQYQSQNTANPDYTSITPQQLPNYNIPGSPLSSYSVGSAFLQLSMPVFSGGGVSAETRQSVDNYDAFLQDKVKIERQTDYEARNAYWRVFNGVSEVQAQKSALLSSKTKLDSDILGYKVGIRNSVDLVNSQKDYYQTFKTYKGSLYQYLLAEIQLQYLSGNLNGQFIRKVNVNIKK